VAVLRLKERRKVIKYVESKIENVQEIDLTPLKKEDITMDRERTRDRR
jgi:hypothetical protein